MRARTRLRVLLMVQYTRSMTALTTVGIHTLGCKVNQYESDRLCQQLRALGLDAAPGRRQAPLHVVNTCSVTAVAEAKGRKLIRRLLHDHPGAQVVVTGCYAQLRPQELAAIPGVRLVAGNDAKGRLASLVLALAGSSPTPALPPARSRCRVFLGVQDGCDNFCAYCTVPHARPHLVSRPASEVEGELRELVAQGVQEVVICGIRLGAYRSASAQHLAALLRRLAATGIPRLRLSSLEPWDIGEELIGELAALPALCPHLHLPAQSGDDQVLARMGRRYDRATYLGLLARLQAAWPGLAITTDLLVGFPGETDQAFAHTVSLAREAGFARIHVFAYSPRPGTRAAGLPEQVPAPVKAERSKVLLALGEELSAGFAEIHRGRVVPVLAETRRAGVCRGYAPDYLPVQFPGAASTLGRIVPVRITGAAGRVARGRPAKELT